MLKSRQKKSRKSLLFYAIIRIFYQYGYAEDYCLDLRHFHSESFENLFILNSEDCFDSIGQGDSSFINIKKIPINSCGVDLNLRIYLLHLHSFINNCLVDLT